MIWMASKKDWKLEAWKAAVSLTEKVFLVLPGTVVIPVLLQKDPLPVSVIATGLIFSATALGIWILLVLRGYKKSGESRR
jgi:hypothetical protein